MDKEIKINDYFVFNYNGDKPKKVYGTFDGAMNSAEKVRDIAKEDIYVLQVVATAYKEGDKLIQYNYEKINFIELNDNYNKLNEKYQKLLKDMYFYKEQIDGCAECTRKQKAKIDDLNEYIRILKQMLNATAELADYYKNKNEELIKWK